MSAIVQAAPRSTLLATFGARYNVDPTRVLDVLKQTCFRTEKPASQEQMIALLVVANNYGLNPFTRELFAFEDKRAGIVPVVSVDGWSRLLNEHDQFDGIEFAFGPEDKNGLPEWCDCTVYRKDRTHPTTVREYMAEVKRNTGPWQSHPRRMLRHKTMIQTARVALGFSGIYDEDEAARIAAGDAVVVDVPAGASRTEQAKVLLSRKVEPVAEPTPPDDDVLPTVDTETGELFDVDASRAADVEESQK
jgi:phage recombination protein Bet